MIANSSTCHTDMDLGPLGINYLDFHRCTMAHYPIFSVIILGLWIIVLFYMLGSTAEVYFSPTLSLISEKLNISYDVAGVTFLAFGNGAPDVFSSVAAFSSGSSDTGINALLGGGMFVTTVVVGAVILNSDVTIHPRAFLRDCGLYWLSLLLTFIISLTPITLPLAFVFPIFYTVYVSMVILGNYCSKGARYHAKDATYSNCVMSAFWHVPIDAVNASSQDRGPLKYSFVTRPNSQTSTESNEYELSEPLYSGTTFSQKLVENYFSRGELPILSSPLIAGYDEGDNTKPVASNDQNESQQRKLPARSGSKRLERSAMSFGRNVWQGIYWGHLRWRQETRRNLADTILKEKSLFKVSLALLEYPFIVMRNLTIPMMESSSWSRLLAAFFPISCPLSILILTGNANRSISSSVTIPLWLVFCIVGSVVSVVIYCTTHRSRPPKTRLYYISFLIVAFIQCIAWIYTIASELVALLDAVGKLTTLPDSFLGMTLLAWGNSVGDLITNVAVSKAGFPEMAIAGCFGGPVFNLLAGMGISMVYATWVNAPTAFHLVLDIHAKVSLAFLCFGIIFTVAIVHHSNYNCPKYLGWLLISFFAVYSTLNVLLLFI